MDERVVGTVESGDRNGYAVEFALQPKAVKIREVLDAQDVRAEDFSSRRPAVTCQIGVQNFVNLIVQRVEETLFLERHVGDRVHRQIGFGVAELELARFSG